MTAPSSRSRWLFRLVVVAGLGAAVYFGLGQFLRSTATVVRATRGTAVKVVLGTVEVAATYTQELKSEVGGRVVSTELDIGRTVARGDVLVRLDPADLDLEIERSRNELPIARQRVANGSLLQLEAVNLRETIANSERLVASGNFPAAELDRQRRALVQLEQRKALDELGSRLALDNLETALRQMERQRAKMTVTSPLDGVIVAVLARPGDLIGSNAPLARIMTITRTVEGKLSEENFAAVALGQKVSVRFLTYGANQYAGVVTKILPSADPETQRYGVHVELTMPEDKPLVPGLTGEISITTDSRPNAILVPRRALVGDYVYVVADGTARVRSVRKGFESLNEVEILSGLAEGETVIVEHQDLFRDGDRVNTVLVTK